MMLSKYYLGILSGCIVGGSIGRMSRFLFFFPGDSYSKYQRKPYYLIEKADTLTYIELGSLEIHLYRFEFVNLIAFSQAGEIGSDSKRNIRTKDKREGHF